MTHGARARTQTACMHATQRPPSDASNPPSCECDGPAASGSCTWLDDGGVHSNVLSTLSTLRGVSRSTCRYCGYHRSEYRSRIALQRTQNNNYNNSHYAADGALACGIGIMGMALHKPSISAVGAMPPRLNPALLKYGIIPHGLTASSLTASSPTWAVLPPARL